MNEWYPQKWCVCMCALSPPRSLCVFLHTHTHTHMHQILQKRSILGVMDLWQNNDHWIVSERRHTVSLACFGISGSSRGRPTRDNAKKYKKIGVGEVWNDGADTLWMTKRTRADWVGLLGNFIDETRMHSHKLSHVKIAVSTTLSQPTLWALLSRDIG